MKIVILDGYPLNPGDLSWEPLRELGECEIYDRTAPDEIIRRCKDADIVLTNKAVLSHEIIDQLPQLKYISVLATGYNIVDVVAARKKGIPVSNVPEYSTKSVAQMVFALLLELTMHVGYHSETVQEGKWTKSKDFSYQDYTLIELDGLTMGIIGLGRIGKAVAELAKAFGMTIIANSPNSSHPGVEMVDIETIFSRSDVISLHCPLIPETQGIVNTARLSLMKPTAYLINTSRGPLIVEQDLADTLNAGKIAGAGMDVLSVEPPSIDNPLLTAKNCIITPHHAWATSAARKRLLSETIENVRAFIDGHPRNVIN
jgi:glycerate dehydrogenase